MRRILFVDDEPRILEGLQRMLRPRRTEWEMSFAVGGEAALACLEAQAFDVIVTDMRMPGMDGAALLARVQERSPETVRIVLSGYTDQDGAARAALVAHQFVSKPAGADTLRAVIDRACALQDSLHNERVRALLGSVDTLPAVPQYLLRFAEAVRAPEPDLAAVAGILAADPAMAAKVLQLVNSSFFGFAEDVTSLRTAVELLGGTMIRNLTLQVEVFRAFDTRKCADAFSIEGLHEHSLFVAHLARRLLPERVTVDDAYAAGILHDTGKLVLADRMPELFAEMVRRARRERVALHVVERAELGVSHAEIGGYLLALWRLPVPLAAAVGFHHAPRVAGEAAVFDLRAAVHVANALAHELEGPVAGVDRHAGLDLEYLEALGVMDRLPAWRALAAHLAGVQRAA